MSTTLVGPLHTRKQVDVFQQKIGEITKQGGTILAGGKAVDPKSLPDV